MPDQAKSSVHLADWQAWEREIIKQVIIKSVIVGHAVIEPVKVKPLPVSPGFPSLWKASPTLVVVVVVVVVVPGCPRS